MVHGAPARNSPSRLWAIVTVFVFLIAGSGCERSDARTKEDVDRQACLGSRLAPIEALAACSRFIALVNDREFKRSDAYYNRGVAFAELGELYHAQLDLEEALKLDPENHWARQRLDDVEQNLSKSSS
jgi:tetratricopeptide (TPR) repeat protein